MRLFVVFEVRNDDEANDDQKEPRRDLIGRNDAPSMDLARVLPRAVEGRDIFGNPNKERNEAKAQRKGHAAPLLQNGEAHLGACEQQKHDWYKNKPGIGQKMIGEEVYVDEDAQDNAPEITRVLLELEVKNAPCLRDIAPYCGIHKSAVERHGADPEKSRFRVTP